MLTRRLARPSAVALCSLALLACEPATDQPDTAEDPAATAGEPGAAAPARTIEATLSEWSVGLSAQTMEAGAVTLLVVNNGQYHHALEVERGDQEWETQHIAPGDTATLEVTLEPGTYEVYCPIDDEHGSHEALGMRTTLTVR